MNALAAIPARAHAHTAAGKLARNSRGKTRPAIRSDHVTAEVARPCAIRERSGKRAKNETLRACARNLLLSFPFPLPSFSRIDTFHPMNSMNSKALDRKSPVAYQSRERLIMLARPPYCIDSPMHSYRTRSAFRVPSPHSCTGFRTSSILN
jgi:hypothetical protein